MSLLIRWKDASGFVKETERSTYTRICGTILRDEVHQVDVEGLALATRFKWRPKCMGGSLPKVAVARPITFVWCLSVSIEWPRGNHNNYV